MRRAKKRPRPEEKFKPKKRVKFNPEGIPEAKKILENILKNPPKNEAQLLKIARTIFSLRKCRQFRDQILNSGPSGRELDDLIHKIAELPLEKKFSIMENNSQSIEIINPSEYAYTFDLRPRKK